jgi:arginine decarboxylase-like protein
MMAYRAKINAAHIDAKRQAALLRELEAGLRGYTYLED